MNVTSGNSYYYATTTCVGGARLSDRRLKKNIEPLKGALDQLTKLRGVTYEWKDPDERRPAGTQTGFIAQDVETVLPGWVETNDKGIKSIVLAPMQLAAMQVEAFREQQAEIADLKAQVAESKRLFDKQQAQLDKQQAEIDEIKHGKDPISGGPGFGPGTIAVFLASVAGATGLMLKRMGLSLATVVGLLIAGRK